MLDKLIERFDSIQESTTGNELIIVINRKELSAIIVGLKVYSSFNIALDEELEKKFLQHKNKKVIE